jgi:hypothetical protein
LFGANVTLFQPGYIHKKSALCFSASSRSGQSVEQRIRVGHMQFTTLRDMSQPVVWFSESQSRILCEIGINYKGQEPEGKLKAEKPESMCSHKIKITEISDIDSNTITIKHSAPANAWPLNMTSCPRALPVFYRN